MNIIYVANAHIRKVKFPKTIRHTSEELRICKVYLAFADVLVLFASTKAGLQRQIDLVVKAMAKCGLQLNPIKCATLGIVADTRRKKAMTETKNIAKINGIAVPAIQPGESYKNLGLHVTSARTFAKLEEKLNQQLDDIGEAPLKPQQRVALVSSNMMPAVYHQLTLAKTTVAALTSLDGKIRVRLKQWLKLPHSVPDAYFFTHHLDGGLDTRNIRFSVPTIKNSKDPLVVYIASQSILASQVSLEQAVMDLLQEP